MQIGDRLSVVFEVRDFSLAQKQWSRFCELMGNEEEFEGMRITGIARGDKFQEVEDLEDEISTLEEELSELR